MPIKTRMKNCAIVFEVSGELDGSSASELAAFLENVAGGHKPVVIDASRVRNLHPFEQAVLDSALKRLRLDWTVMLPPGEQLQDKGGVKNAKGKRI